MLHSHAQSILTLTVNNRTNAKMAIHLLKRIISHEEKTISRYPVERAQEMLVEARTLLKTARADREIDEGRSDSALRRVSASGDRSRSGSRSDSDGRMQWRRRRAISSDIRGRDGLKRI